MQWVEYGKAHEKTVILLHGGGLSWWNYREAAELLQNRYHVVLPILDGHVGSSADFVSIEQNARGIITYIDEVHGGSVELIGGLSLGAQILLEILAQRSAVTQYALIESASAIPMKWTHALIQPMMDMSYGLIRQKWFARLQFQWLRMKDDLFPEYYRDTCRIAKENMISFLRANAAYAAKEELAQSQAKALICVGGNESAHMQRSARLLNRLLPNSELKALPNLHHGEFSINHAQEYVETIIHLPESP